MTMSIRPELRRELLTLPAEERLELADELYESLVDRARAFYVGEYWVKHFDVRLGEELKR